MVDYQTILQWLVSIVIVLTPGLRPELFNDLTSVLTRMGFGTALLESVPLTLQTRTELFEFNSWSQTAFFDSLPLTLKNSNRILRILVLVPKAPHRSLKDLLEQPGKNDYRIILLSLRNLRLDSRAESSDCSSVFSGRFLK